jgi:hypothetical protein
VEREVDSKGFDLNELRKTAKERKREGLRVSTWKGGRKVGQLGV